MLNFQEMIMRLTQFWAGQNCLIHQGYDLEVGAGTFNPATFLRCLGPEPYRAVYVEPSRRPKDGRYGENPNRVQFYHQMQVILKPSPPNVQDLYLKSLEAVGFDLNKHDIRFVHDDWENPTIGAWGLGWEIWADGMEITQFTYFQAVGGLSVKPVSGEITYGLERLAMYLQGVDSMFDLNWNNGITYGDVFKRSEWEWSHYNFHQADAAMWLRHFEDFENECKRLIKNGFPIPAYDFVMKASHAFNILDARGVISVTERTAYITRIRNLANLMAQSYIKSREEQNYPLLKQVVEPAALAPLPILTKCAPQEKQDLLLEIGSEELPAIFVSIGLQNLEHLMKEFLEKEGIPFDKIQTYGTPRRLAVYVSGLAGGIEAKKIEKKGPTLAAAFESDGTLTKAGAGFFRSLNLEPVQLSQIQKGNVKELEIRKVGEAEYLFAHKEIKEVSTRALLAEELPKLILQIDFPKKMRWGSLDIEYARPLRWVLALYGEENIPFYVGDLRSGKETYGHRQLSNEKIVLTHPKEYLTALRKHWVLADVEERKESILDQLKKLEQNSKGTALAKEKVMPQVLHLVEWPFLTLGNFDSQFLKAPKEVLVSEMVEHQKYFPLADKNGAIQNAFIIVCNNTPSDLIRKGNQKALSPRLADGMFLYEEDAKKPLESFNEKLKTMTFQKELGTMWAKVERLMTIASLIHQYLPICDRDKLVHAASLCKADLASELVGEFPELQGHVGKLYALKHNEEPQVAEAIEEHWMPKGEKAPLPKTGCGILLSLADKIDNFLSCFVLDLKPSSSSDPYALRRQALGMIKMLIEGKYYLPLNEVFSKAFDLFLENPELNHKQREKFGSKKEATLQEINQFLTNRARTVYSDYGFEKDEIEAALSQGLTCCFDTYQKLEALHAFRKENRTLFHADLEIYTRVKKILFSQNPRLVPHWMAKREIGEKSNRYPAANANLFSHKSEKNLFARIGEMRQTFGSVLFNRKEIKETDYQKAFTLLSELGEPLKELFDSVKIIDDNLDTRNNRLALLQEVWDLCEELLDFSKIQEHEMKEK